MTHPVYYTAPAEKQSTALITDLGYENAPYLVLDQTIFYPEGGGQPCDLGHINDIALADVQKEQGQIKHYLKLNLKDFEALNLKIGAPVTLTLDVQRRKDFSQQHAGQHLLSAILETTFDANTVGFHIGEDYMTIDIDKPLSKEQLDLAEKKCNALISEGLAIKAYYPDAETLGQMPLRKKPSVTENIRIVEIDGFDYSPCGGLHPESTLEILLLKIRRFEKQKQGLRIDFICGRWALNDYHEKNAIIQQLGAKLSVRPFEIIEHCDRFIEENAAMNKALKKLKKEYLALKGKALEDNYIDFCNYKLTTFHIEGTMGDLKQMVQPLSQTSNRLIIASSLDKDKFSLCLAKSKDIEPLNMGQLFKTAIQTIGGKGGGNAFMAQGGGTLETPDAIEPLILLIMNLFKENLA